MYYGDWSQSITINYYVLCLPWQTVLNKIWRIPFVSIIIIFDLVKITFYFKASFLVVGGRVSIPDTEISTLII